MPLTVIFLEGIVYSLGLWILFVGKISLERMAQGGREWSRLRAWIRMVGGTLAITSVFFLQQTVFLLSSWSTGDLGWFYFYLATEIAFCFSLALTTWFGCSFLEKARSDDAPLWLKRAFMGLPLATALAYAVSLVANLPRGRALLEAGESIGWPNFVVIASSIILLGCYFAHRRRIIDPEPRGLCFSFILVVLFSLIAEVVTYALPMEIWDWLGISRYLTETSLVISAYFLVSLAYIRRETRETEKRKRTASDEFASGAPASVTLERFCERFSLSSREVEVVRCLCLGMSNQKIADTLFVSLSTVKTHLHRILVKTGRKSRTALVAQFGGQFSMDGSQPLH